jgi:hypothetical protein
VTPSGTPQDFVTTPLKAPFSSFSATDAQCPTRGHRRLGQGPVTPSTQVAEPHLSTSVTGSTSSNVTSNGKHIQTRR